MLVQDLHLVHRRYITLSNLFKSAWTFHQFLQGLRKVFVEQAPGEYSVDFQNVYSQLKAISENLTEVAAEEAAQQLNIVDQQIQALIQILLTVDAQISPALLRQFFLRVKNFDDNILSQLLKFYLYTHEAPQAWAVDRLDKADYIATKLCEEYIEGRDHFATRDHTHLREVAEGLWTAVGAPSIADSVVTERCRQFEILRREIQALDSIDNLASNNLVKRYREFKHSLGSSFFEPRILYQIIETNLALKNGIHELYRREEQRIVAEYQQVFELEREVPVDLQLSQELKQFRHAVERFEKRLQGSDIRLDELSELRNKVRELIPKLQPEPGEVDPYGEFPAPQLGSATTEASSPALGQEDAHLEKQYRAVVAALDQLNPSTEPKKACLMPEVFGLGISPREVVAYRRLFGAPPSASADRKLEDFLLRVAALRIRIEQDVEMIKGILDDSAATRQGPVFSQAAITCRLADHFVRQFEHLIEHKLLNDDGREAKSLLTAKMKLLRCYAGLWLMLYRE